MDFSFSDEQHSFRQTLRDFLDAEVTPTRIRALWDAESGRSDNLWLQLAELGLTGMTVPEAHGGLGMNAVDVALLAEECGYAALPEPLVDTQLVAIPLLCESRNETLASHWLPRVASGAARVAVGLACDPLVADAETAALLLLQHQDELHAVPRADVVLRRNESMDPSRRLFQVAWQPGPATLLLKGDVANSVMTRALNAGALGAAAQLLGLAQRMLDLAVAYTRDRKQFGKAIGSFQAVQHLLASVTVKLEYARAPVYRAAYALAHDRPHVDVAVSHAKIAAAEAALAAARQSIQVHGAMGYTWDVDLHIFAKRAWALDGAWGERSFHKARIADFALATNSLIGAGMSFL